MNRKIIKACFTGYRPEKFDFKLNNTEKKFCLLVSRINETLSSLIKDGCNSFYCGMAPGFDIIAAECIVALKSKNKDLRLVCVIPYINHQFLISDEWKDRYNYVLHNSDEIVYTSEEYHVSCFQIRNRYMVDASDCVICWYDGKAGGTLNTIKYAQKQNKYVININVECEIELNNTQEKLPL